MGLVDERSQTHFFDDVQVIVARCPVGAETDSDAFSQHLQEPVRRRWQASSCCPDCGRRGRVFLP